MKTAIYIIVLIAMVLWVGDLKITLNPFTIKLQAWQMLLAWLLILIGAVIIGYGGYKKAYKIGYNEAMNDAYEVIEEVLTEAKQESQ